MPIGLGKECGDTRHSGQKHLNAPLAPMGLDVVSAPMRAQPSAVLAWVASLLVVFTSLTYLAGDTSSLPPHWFYLPIVMPERASGSPVPSSSPWRPAHWWAPPCRADVIQGTPQETSDWLTRTFFFAGIGTMVAALMRQAARGIERERQQVTSARRRDDFLVTDRDIESFGRKARQDSGQRNRTQAPPKTTLPATTSQSPERMPAIANSTAEIRNRIQPKR